MKSPLSLLAAVSLAAVAASPAQAASYVFNLSANPANTFFNGNNFTLDIDYADGPFTLAQGDDITLNLDLTGLLTTPTLASGDGVLFVDVLLSQGLQSPGNGGLTTETSTTMNDGTYAGETQFSGCFNCIFSAFGKPASGTPYSFSSLTATYNILNLEPNDPNSPVDGTGFRLNFVQFGAVVVPEPGSWALMIVGFGAVGAAARRRRSAVLAAA